MIGHPAPQNRGVRTSNHDRSWGSKRWLGRTEFLTRTIRSEPRLESAKPSTRAKWRSSRSACGSVFKNVLDTADIVRDRDISTVRVSSTWILSPDRVQQRPKKGGRVDPPATNNKPLTVQRSRSAPFPSRRTHPRNSHC